MAHRLSNKDKLRSLIAVTISGTTLFVGACIYQGNEKFYDKAVMPLTRLLDPELSHNLAVFAAKWGLNSKQKLPDPETLMQTVWGLKFDNPVGMAAGFDKQGEAVENLTKMGFGFVEIGKYF